LLPSYRPEITVQKTAGGPAITLVQPSEAAVLPRPAGEPERTFEMAFA
jgi:hypothetical protein